MSADVILAAVGDIALGDHLLTFGHGTRSLMEQRGGTYPFDAVAELLASADLRFGNLESVISDAGRREDDIATLVMRGAPRAAASLAGAGFDVLNVANNHMAQFGVQAYRESLARLQGAGIEAIGDAAPEGGSRAVLRTVKGMRIGLLGYSFVPERFMRGKPPYALGEPDAIRRDVEALRPAVDCLIVSCHWGLELVDRPSADTIALARALVEWGADVVLGHHPHVFQGIERYRRGLICYSLGNFVFDSVWDRPCRASAVLSLTLRRRGGALDIDWRAAPVTIADDFRPRPARPEAAEAFHRYLERISDAAYIDPYRADREEENKRYYLAVARAERAAQASKFRFVLRHLHRLDRRALRALLAKPLRRLHQTLRQPHPVEEKP